MAVAGDASRRTRPLSIVLTRLNLGRFTPRALRTLGESRTRPPDPAKPSDTRPTTTKPCSTTIAGSVSSVPAVRDRRRRNRHPPLRLIGSASPAKRPPNLRSREVEPSNEVGVAVGGAKLGGGEQKSESRSESTATKNEKSHVPMMSRETPTAVDEGSTAGGSGSVSDTKPRLIRPRSPPTTRQSTVAGRVRWKSRKKFKLPAADFATTTRVKDMVVTRRRRRKSRKRVVSAAFLDGSEVSDGEQGTRGRGRGERRLGRPPRKKRRMSSSGDEVVYYTCATHTHVLIHFSYLST